MAKVSLNLLPPEILASQKQNSTLGIFNYLASGVIVLAIIAASSALIFKLFLTQQLSEKQLAITTLENDLSTLQIQESLLFNLRKRLQSITTLSNQPSSILERYNLAINLIPSDFKLLYLTFNKKDETLISVESSSSARLKSLFDNLTDPGKTAGRLSSAKLEGLSRVGNETYKIDLNLLLK